MEGDAKKSVVFSDSEDNEISVQVAGAAVLVTLASVGVIWFFLFNRRRWKLNEITAEDVQYQRLYNHDIGGIGLSRNRVISLSANKEGRSPDEEEIGAVRSEGTYDENMDNDVVFMTFEQLKSAQGSKRVSPRNERVTA